MTVVLRAEDQPVASRLDYWREVIEGAAVPLEIRYDHGPAIRSRITSGDAGPVRVAEVDDASGEAVRTRGHIRRSTARLYQLIVQARGSVLIEQDGRRDRLGVGDLAVSDPSRPFRCVHPARRFVCATFPQTLLPLRQDEIAQLTGTRIPGDRGGGALVCSLVRRLPGVLSEGDSTQLTRLGTAVLDLVAVALATRLDRTDAIAPGTSQRALLLRIQAFIEERLGDPNLTPGLIAAAHHISPRYLHRLFEPSGTPVAAWIRHRRLEQCRRDLLNPELADRPAYAIGARWGMPEAAHFTRAFRSRYGSPPAEYRRTGGLTDP